jgi:hypothetical protein
MEMEIRHSYTEVISMLEGVLLHIFRNLQGNLYELPCVPALRGHLFA